MIVQAGPYPEPFGGISVFVKRMKERLDDWGIANEVWDLSGREGKPKNRGVFSTRLVSVPFKCILRSDVRLIHYHICGVRSKLFIAFFNKLLFRKRKKVLTIHGDARCLFKRRAGLMIRALNSFDAVICVRSGDRQYLRGRGVRTAVFEIPAIIFPVVRSGGHDLQAQIRDFIATHGFIMCANASSIELYQHSDLYGMDMCLRLTARLKEIRPDLRPGFIFCLSRINDTYRFKEYQALIKKLNLEKDFTFVTEIGDLHPILQNSHLFIRPTNTDGYSISLAEALYFGIPSLASDAVPRPEGTVLFKTRDDDSLLCKTIAIIKNYQEHQSKVRSLKFDDYAGQLLSVYQELLCHSLFDPFRSCHIAKDV